MDKGKGVGQGGEEHIGCPTGGCGPVTLQRCPMFRAPHGIQRIWVCVCKGAGGWGEDRHSHAVHLICHTLTVTYQIRIFVSAWAQYP